VEFNGNTKLTLIGIVLILILRKIHKDLIKLINVIKKIRVKYKKKQ